MIPEEHSLVNLAELVRSRPVRDPVSKTKVDGTSQYVWLSSDHQTHLYLHICTSERAFTHREIKSLNKQNSIFYYLKNNLSN